MRNKGMFMVVPLGGEWRVVAFCQDIEREMAYHSLYGL
jgi:hypothetical protein